MLTCVSRNSGRRAQPLDLGARLDIAIDVAHAVTYLHMYSGLFQVLRFFVILICFYSDD